MKYVVGIVPPSALERVQRALGEAEIYRLTVSEVEVVRPGEMVPPSGLARGLRLEIAVNDEFLAPAVNAFEKVAAELEKDRPAGDARASGVTRFPIQVSVLPLESAVRIRTSERGPEAI